VLKRLQLIRPFGTALWEVEGGPELGGKKTLAEAFRACRIARFPQF
jgi:hypothetical protein